MTALPLAGRVIALPETRELDLFAEMLEKRGALPLRCPLVGIHDAPDPKPIETWLKLCCEGQFNDLILLTGEGLRRLRGFAERAGVHADFLAALGKLRTVTRGPKPARALREVDLKPHFPAAVPTTEGVIETLRTLELRDRRVGVQLYGEEPNRPLMDFLAQAGALSFPVAPYRYADAAENREVAALIDALAAGRVDAIAFTSTPQVLRLLDVAKATGRSAVLANGFRQVKIAAIGPIVAETLKAQGLRVDLMPAESYFLKPLISELVDHLGPKT
ncbi:MAG: uroporphyrinogen-III synthase [Nevskiales bacterium]